MTLLKAALAAAALLATAAAPPASAGAPAGAWVPAYAGAPLATRPLLAAFPNGVGYVAGGTSPDVAGLAEQRSELHRTTDYGRTWTRLPGIPGATVFPGVAFASPTEGWAYDQNQLLRSTDSGVTWSAAGTLPLPAGEVLQRTWDGFSISRDGAAMVVAGQVSDQAATTGGGCPADRGHAILVSGDDGATWTEHRFPELDSGNGVHVDSVQAIDADTAVAVTMDLVHEGGCQSFGGPWSVRLTDDGGATWRTVATAPPNGSIPSVAATVTAAGTIVVGRADGTVTRSTDGGATWTPPARLAPVDRVELYPGWWLGPVYVRITQVVFAGTVGYAVLESGQVWRSSDDGATWAPDGVAAGYQPRVAVFDGDDAFAAGVGLVSYRLS